MPVTTPSPLNPLSPPSSQNTWSTENLDPPDWPRLGHAVDRAVAHLAHQHRWTQKQALLAISHHSHYAYRSIQRLIAADVAHLPHNLYQLFQTCYALNIVPTEVAALLFPAATHTARPLQIQRVRSLLGELRQLDPTRADEALDLYEHTLHTLVTNARHRQDAPVSPEDDHASADACDTTTDEDPVQH